MQTIKDSTTDEYITTYTGRKVYPMAKDQSRNDYALEDIAHSLSRIVRFNGHVEQDYTVGHHALLVTEVLRHHKLNELIQLQGLHHDDSEAFLCDIPKPIKHLFKGYEEQEKLVQNEILKKLGVLQPTELEYKMIKAADFLMLQNEALKLSKHLDWANKKYDLSFIVFFECDRNDIKKEFIRKHYELMLACKNKGFL